MVVRAETRSSSTATKRGENFELYVVGSDGGKAKALAHDPAGDSAPAWSPGESILFTSDRGGNDDLYVVNGDGTGLKQLTDHAGHDVRRHLVTRRSEDRLHQHP